MFVVGSQRRWARRLCRVGREALVRVHHTRRACSPAHHVDAARTANVKSAQFYAEWAGRLFLEDTEPKDLTSHIKHAKFLTFFHRRLQPNHTGWHDAYPLVSPCGDELNFVLPADRGVVFRELVRGEGGGGGDLVWGGSLRVPFDPAALVVSDLGRMYHPTRTPLGYGLVCSHVALQIGEHVRDSGEGLWLEWGGATHAVALVQSVDGLGGL